MQATPPPPLAARAARAARAASRSPDPDLSPTLIPTPATTPALTLALCVAAQVVLLRYRNEMRKPGPAFNYMTSAAYEDGSDYMYRVNDDTMFSGPWLDDAARLAYGCSPVRLQRVWLQPASRLHASTATRLQASTPTRSQASTP